MLESSLSKDDFGMAVFFPDKMFFSKLGAKGPGLLKKRFGV
jgi:hypothetical protein